MLAVPTRCGDAIFASVDGFNAERFTLTYGAIVRQLLTDLEDVEEVNKQLNQMLIDEFLAKANFSRCVEFKETAEVIAKTHAKALLQCLKWSHQRCPGNDCFFWVSLKTEVTCIRDILRGDDAYEMLVKLLKQVLEE